MAVTEETPTASSVANGVTTVFPHNFTVLDAGDLVVTGELAGLLTTYALGVDYTVAGIGSPSGSVTFLVAPASGTVITRYRDTALERETDYQDNGDLLADAVNLDFDRLWLALQEIFYGAKAPPSALRVPSGETIPAFGNAASRADKFPFFNGSGDPTVVSLPSGQPVSSSDQVAWTQSGAGAVGRTVQDKLREQVSVADYGVTGDGVTDDTAELELAITANPGKDIIIPPGFNCLVSSEVDMNQAGVRLIGYGATITKDAAFTGSGIFRVTAEDVTLEGFEIEGTDKADDGVITSAGVAAGFTARRLKVRNCLYGLSPNSNSRIRIEDCDISLVASGGIRCHNIADTVVNTDIKIIRGTIDLSDLDPATATQVGLLVRGTATKLTTDVLIDGVRFKHCTDPTASGALACECRFTDGARFVNCNSLDGSMLVSMAGSPNYHVGGNVCDGATFYGIEIAGISGVSCDGGSIGTNTIDGRGRLNYAIGLQGAAASKGITIAPQKIRGVVQYGIFCNDMWDDVAIAVGSIDISASAANQYGIYAIGPIDGFHVSGGVMNGNGVAEKAIYLIDVTNWSISGVSMRGWTQNDVLLHSITAIGDGSITGCTMGSGLAVNAISTTGAGTFGRIQARANPGYRLTNTEATDILDLANGLYEAWGTVAPETNVTAGGGSIYHRRNGGAGTSLYVKEDAAVDATGWVGK